VTRIKSKHFQPFNPHKRPTRLLFNANAGLPIFPASQNPLFTSLSLGTQSISVHNSPSRTYNNCQQLNYTANETDIKKTLNEVTIFSTRETNEGKWKAKPPDAS